MKTGITWSVSSGDYRATRYSLLQAIEVVLNKKHAPLMVESLRVDRMHDTVNPHSFMVNVEYTTTDHETHCTSMDIFKHHGTLEQEYLALHDQYVRLYTNDALTTCRWCTIDDITGIAPYEGKHWKYPVTIEGTYHTDPSVCEHWEMVLYGEIR